MTPNLKDIYIANECKERSLKMETNFKIIRNKVQGNVDIFVDMIIHNLLAEKVVVNENITAKLFGSIQRLILKKGSIVFLYGEAPGSVRNEGGVLYVNEKSSDLN